MSKHKNVFKYIDILQVTFDDDFSKRRSKNAPLKKWDRRALDSANTISMFNIDLTNPDILTMVGAPIGSEGEFPMSLAVSETNGMVCVLNGGANNGVA